MWLYFGISDQSDADAEFPLLTTAEFGRYGISFFSQIDVFQSLLRFQFNQVFWHALNSEKKHVFGKQKKKNIN